MKGKLFLALLTTALLLTGCDFLAGNFVWEDLDMDGIQDPGEPGLAGVTVILREISNNGTISTTTDAMGFYSFVMERDDRDYRIEFVLPDGYVFSPKGAGSNIEIDSDADPATGFSDSFIVYSGIVDFSDDNSIDAGMYLEPAPETDTFEEGYSIGDSVWVDTNANGVQDSGEEGLEGVEVKLWGVESGAVLSTNTDALGLFEFANMPEGEYKLEVLPPEGYSITAVDVGSNDALDSDVDPDTGFSANFTLGAADDFNWDAGLLEPEDPEDATSQIPLVSGPDPDDFPPGTNPMTGLPFCEPEAENWGTVGISISHFPPGPTRPPTGLSSAAWVTEWWIGDGDTRMYALYYGCYPETYQPEGGESSELSGAPEVGEDQFLISDFVWFDLNGNSIQDAGEPGVPGVQVTLIRQGQDILSTVTDASGHYYLLLNNPEIGRNYRVRFDLPSTSTGNFYFVDVNLVNEAVDSDANPGTGLTGLFPLPTGQNSINYIDAGVRHSILVEGIRSGRLVFQQVNKYFGACSIVSGVDPTVGQSINICATAGFSDPNNIGAAGVDISRLKEIAEQTASDEPRNYTGNMFSVAPPPGGEEAQKLDMFYNVNNITQWQFDAAGGNYIRYQNSPQSPDVQEMSTERLTGEPLGFENVIVMFVNHNQLNAAGTIFETDMDFTTGTAKIFRDGMVYDVQWSTLSGEYEQETGMLRPIRFQNPDGTPFHLKPGKLWIHMVHTATGFSQPEPGCWRARWFAPIFEAE